MAEELGLDESMIAPQGGWPASMSRLGVHVGQRISSVSVYVHSGIAVSLNILAMLATKPFYLLPQDLYFVFFLISIVTTYRYLYNFKSYEILDF